MEIRQTIKLKATLAKPYGGVATKTPCEFIRNSENLLMRIKS